MISISSLNLLPNDITGVLTAEVIVCLKHSLQPVRINPEDRLRDIRLLRSRIRPDVVTAEDIDRAIDEGRP